MSREEVSACLRNLQLSLDGLQRELEGSIRALPETKRWVLGGGGCWAVAGQLCRRQLVSVRSASD